MSQTATPEKSQEKELHELSNSRIHVENKCGLAFKYQYVDKLPAPYETGALIFGHAIHDGIAEWYGVGVRTPTNAKQHQILDLPELVDAQWERLLPPKVYEAVMGMIELGQEARAVAEAIKLGRPELRAPTQTKAYLNSEAVKKLNKAREEMLELCDASSEVKWPKTEDPYQAYLKAHAIAERLQEEWRPQPRPLLVEQQFVLEFEGFTLHGRLDQLRQDMDPNTGEALEPAIHDTKTGANLFSQMGVFVQAFIYREAVAAMDDAPTTNKVVFDMVRHTTKANRTKSQIVTIDPERHRKRALSILNGTARRIITADFEPRFGFWCDRCDFSDLCEAELGLWTGDGTGDEI